MTGTSGTSTEAKRKPLSGRHVLYWMSGFFAAMFVVNGIFLYFAITSFPGEDTKKSYLQGLNYNQTLDTRAAQDALGWRAEIGLREDHIVLRLTDSDGQTLHNLTATGELRRRASGRFDQTLTFEQATNGTYIAK